MKVFLAGRVAVESNGDVIDERRFPGRQGRLLFAYLVMGRGRSVPRDELADVLWEGNLPATWDKALSVLASKLRGLLDSDGIDESSALVAAFGCYRLELPAGSWVDILAAENAAEEADAALARDDVEEASRAAALAESLLRPRFLPGDDGTWVEGKRRELAGVRARALSALADACLRSGDARESVRWAEQAVDVEPFRESGYRRLMDAHVVAGNRAEALRVYERCRRLLAEELGAYPSPETDALHRRLLELPTARAADALPPEVATTTEHGARRRVRRTTAVLVGLLAVAGAVAATVALENRGSSTPPVLPNSLARLDPHTLRVTQVVPVGSQPDLVVAAGGFVWITNHVLRDAGSGALRNAGDRTLTRVDPSTGKAVVVGGGLAPCGLTADPSGDVWVADCYPRAAGSRDNVVRVGARTLDFERIVPVPGGDGFYRGLAYGGGSLWVGQIEGGDSPNVNTITEVDPQTGTERSFRPERPAGGMTWADGYGDLWITNFDYGSLARLHTETGSVNTLQMPLANPVFPLIDGDAVWVADWGAADVARVRAVGRPEPQRIVLPVHNPYAGVWNIAAGAGDVWATTPRDGSLWRIDPKTNTVTRIVVPYLPTGVAADATDVWVTVRGQ